MATIRNPLIDEGYWSSDETNVSVVNYQNSQNITSTPPDNITELLIAELCERLADLTLTDPPLPLPPPILLVTDETCTPILFERQLARAIRIGTDANLAEIARSAGEEEVFFGLKPPRVWPQRLSPLWQSQKAQKYGFKKPDRFHPFLNRLSDKRRCYGRYRQL